MGVVLSNDAKPGTYLELDNNLFVVIEYNHVKPGKGGAFIRLKLRNLRLGTVVDRTVNSGEKMTSPEVEEKKMQFLYKQGDEYVFMDQDTYEQIHLTRASLGDKINWLKEEMIVDMLMHQGESLDLQLPFKVELKVTHTEPSVRGNTVTNVTKEAVVETGAKIQVPMFVNEGDMVRIDTRTGEYLERV
ncbi:elongation factor P [candidate division FCPU426 bacterium]|nr:elongation factor P [candidate division FCPU426 bacterium]